MTFDINDVRVVVGNPYSCTTSLNSNLVSPKDLCDKILGYKKEVDGLVKILEEHGVNTARPDRVPRIRDEYFFTNDFCLFEDSRYKLLGLNTSTQQGNDYVFVPEIVYNCAKKRDPRAVSSFYSDISRVHLLPTSEKSYSLRSDLLLLPEKKLVVVDSDYYKYHKKELERIANSEDLEIRTVASSKLTLPNTSLQRTIYPTDSLDLGQSDVGKLLIFTTQSDEESPMKSALSEFDIGVVEVPFGNHLNLNQSIKTNTNFVPFNYIFK